MTDALQTVKNLAVVRALALIAGGHTKAKACSLAGISESTLDRRIADEPNLVSEFVAVERGRIQDLYEKLGEAHEEVVEELIREAKKPDLKVNEKLSIEARLRELRGLLEQQLMLVQEKASDPTPISSTKSAEEFLASLTGPQLVKGKAVFTERRAEITFEGSESDREVLDTESSE